MEQFEKKIAEHLLQIKAIKLSPATPFTWASGWKSPIYCDNRKTLSFPVVRTYIRDRFADLIRHHFPEVEVIAGVATGAIPHGMLVADVMQLPFVYVRSAPKDHGLENLIEGSLEAGQKVVVVEDLISTGNSSLKAIDALRTAGATVLGMTAIFTYQFPVAEESFKKADVPLYTLSNYSALIDQALETGFVDASQLESLKQWRKDPSVWGK
jgi:orotate phosphoribosyltransferase